MMCRWHEGHAIRQVIMFYNTPALLYQVNMHCFTGATSNDHHALTWKTIATMQVIQHHEAQFHQNKKTAGEEL
jgi:hypothetical protein